MQLIIDEGVTRGYLTEDKMYSNGKQIRLITSFDMFDVYYNKVINGVVQNDTKKCKLETFESWAKWRVRKKTW